MWKFEKSASGRSSLIEHEKSEVVFWGRSNVGKSSLINAIAKQGIAKTSNTPGRTQLINYFKNQNDDYLVDLPGYGYAKVNKSKQQEMNDMIDEYLTLKTNIKCVFLLIDSRIGFMNSDIEVIEYLNMLKLPIFIVFTKIDKLKQSDIARLAKITKENKIEHYVAVSASKMKNIAKLESIVMDYLYNI